MTSHQIAQSKIEPDQREITATRNRQAFVLLLQKYPSVIIPQRDFDQWRATQPTAGHINGLFGELDCVATNGLLGLFIDALNEPLIGHVKDFMWTHAQERFVLYVDEETGEEKRHRVVKEQGAPGPLHSVPRVHIITKEHKEKAKKVKAKRKSHRQEILDSL